MAGRSFPMSLQGLGKPAIVGTDPHGMGSPDGHFPQPDHTPFMKGDQGPFECSNCKFFDNNTCSEPHIVDFASQGLYGLTLTDDSHAAVDGDDCSDYFTPGNGGGNGSNG